MPSIPIVMTRAHCQFRLTFRKASSACLRAVTSIPPDELAPLNPSSWDEPHLDILDAHRLVAILVLVVLPSCAARSTVCSPTPRVGCTRCRASFTLGSSFGRIRRFEGLLTRRVVLRAFSRNCRSGSSLRSARALRSVHSRSAPALLFGSLRAPSSPSARFRTWCQA